MITEVNLHDKMINELSLQLSSKIVIDCDSYFYMVNPPDDWESLGDGGFKRKCHRSE